MFKNIVLYIKFLICKLNKVYFYPYNEDYDDYLNDQLVKINEDVVKYHFGTILIDDKWIIIDNNKYYGTVSGETFKYIYLDHQLKQWSNWKNLLKNRELRITKRINLLI